MTALSSNTDSQIKLLNELNALLNARHVGQKVIAGAEVRRRLRRHETQRERR